MKAVSPNVTSVHCFIHRLALSTKVLPSKLISCLNQIIKMVNVVKTSALNTRLFKLICEDLGSDHTCLLHHTEMRWLSRGNITKRLFQLRDELLVFLREKDHDFRKYLEWKRSGVVPPKISLHLILGGKLDVTPSVSRVRLRLPRSCKDSAAWHGLRNTALGFCMCNENQKDFV